MEHVTPDEFDSSILKDSERKIVLFYASWCPYCSNFKPSFEAASIGGARKVGALVDEDENPLWDRFDIQAVPTIIAFENGKAIARRDAKKSIGLTRSDLESLARELA